MKRIYLLMMAAAALGASAQDLTKWNFRPSSFDTYVKYNAGQPAEYFNSRWFTYDSHGRLIEAIEGVETDLLYTYAPDNGSRSLDLERVLPDKFVYEYDPVVTDWCTSCKAYTRNLNGNWDPSIYDTEAFTMEVTRDPQNRITGIFKPEDDSYGAKRLTVAYGADGKASKITYEDLDEERAFRDLVIMTDIVWLETDGQINVLGDLAQLCMRGSKNRPLSCHVEEWKKGKLREVHDITVTYTDDRGSFSYVSKGREYKAKSGASVEGEWAVLDETITYTYTDDYGSFKSSTTIKEGDWDPETTELAKTYDRFGIEIYNGESIYGYLNALNGTVTYDPATGLPVSVSYDRGNGEESRLIFHGAHEAGIREIAAEGSEQLYDLLGRKTSGRRPGLYISRSGKHLRR